MNLNEIEAKCFIMALFIRDDGLRFLLGSGAYEFKDSQLMFAGNTIENDVVSVQGNDGYMLAGQVRRPTTQVFDGYIGDASVPKSEVEGYRRDFMAFFQKNHFYTVVYVMADGSAIQRRRGFLVDAPTSQELWQMYPEYHVALNFEDVNYYKYSENDDGEETYAKSADIGLAKVQYGGLIWDNNSDIEISGTGTNITLAGTMEGGAIESVELNGDTEQQTYSGKNLYEGSPSFDSFSNISAWEDGGTYNGMPVIKRAAAWTGVYRLINVEAGVTYTFSAWVKSDEARTVAIYAIGSGATATITPNNKNITTTTSWERVSFTFTCSTSGTVALRFENTSASTTNYTYISGYQLEKNSSMTSFEPYVGGTASPNPDYPQAVQTVTGEQTITVSNGQGESQVCPINLGKNLANIPDCNISDTGYSLNIESGAIELNSTTINKTFDLCGGSAPANWLPTYANANDYHLTPTGGTWTLNASDISGTISGTQSLYVAIMTNQRQQNTFISSAMTYTPYTITLADDEYIKSIYLWCGSNTTYNSVKFKLQLEKGSTATTYAPYFTPIELCKIGDYQDYIYKSGEDWYVHKEIGKYTLDGSLAWYESGSCFKLTLLNTDLGYAPMNSGYVFYPATDSIGLWCNYGIAKSGYKVFQGTEKGVGLGVGGTGGGPADGIYVTGGSLTLANFQTMLNTSPLVCDYILATPTDTQITNSALIAQLEALNEATTYDGKTIITVSSEYLASPLEITVISIGGGGVVWDENGAEWEAGGGGEIVIVNVDSIENILPVWTIRGEAENPTLTNLTTGMSITYNGTVASGQTLVIDLLNKTAKLNGTSVISDVSGQWVEFEPGNNRVSYSTENANAPDSTIEWQEVVG